MQVHRDPWTGLRRPVCEFLDLWREVRLEQRFSFCHATTEQCVVYGLQCFFFKDTIAFAMRCFAEAARRGHMEAAFLMKKVPPVVTADDQLTDMLLADYENTSLISTVLGILLLRAHRRREAQQFLEVAQKARYPYAFRFASTREEIKVGAALGSADCLYYVSPDAHREQLARNGALGARFDAIKMGLGSLEERALWLGMLAGQSRHRDVYCQVSEFLDESASLYERFVFGRAMARYGFASLDQISSNLAHDCVFFYLAYCRFVSEGVYELLLCLQKLVPRDIGQKVAKRALEMREDADWMEDYVEAPQPIRLKREGFGS